jgi:hypothetical protein
MAPSEASRGLLLVLGSGAVVLISLDMFWPLALVWVACAALVLYHDHDDQPDPTEPEQIASPT